MKELPVNPNSPFNSRLFHWASIVALGGAVFVCIFFLYSQNSSPTSSLEPRNLSSNQTTETKRGLPSRLQIPKIKVDASVESVGITAAGAMDTPRDRFNVAWYNQGPRPGERGSAVIDGHLDGENQTEAVFKDLNQIQVGDTITVIDEKNTRLIFTVRSTKLYQSTADTREVFINPNGYYLNLITCAGAWDQARQDYEERLVVFSELTSIE